MEAKQLKDKEFICSFGILQAKRGIVWIKLE
jgi:hypothetical protein